MPYAIREEDGGFVVYNKDTGEAKNKTPHKTREKAKRHLSALYAATADEKVASMIHDEYMDKMGAVDFDSLEKKKGKVKYRGKWYTPNKPVPSPRKNKKRMVLATKTVDGKRKAKVVHYGHESYSHNYDPKAKANYLRRSAGIRNAKGELTKDDPFSANHWARKDLWPEKADADGSAKWSIDKKAHVIVHRSYESEIPGLPINEGVREQLTKQERVRGTGSTLLGAGAGAGFGASIAKNKGRGALIGTALGAGLGLLGHHLMQKKIDEAKSVAAVGKSSFKRRARQRASELVEDYFESVRRRETPKVPGMLSIGKSLRPMPDDPKFDMPSGPYVFDKTKWYTDNGVDASHLDELVDNLMVNKLLNEEGLEMTGPKGIVSDNPDFALTSDMLTDEGKRLLFDNYDNYRENYVHKAKVPLQTAEMQGMDLLMPERYGSMGKKAEVDTHLHAGLHHHIVEERPIAKEFHRNRLPLTDSIREQLMDRERDQGRLLGYILGGGLGLSGAALGGALGSEFGRGRAAIPGAIAGALLGGGLGIRSGRKAGERGAEEVARARSMSAVGTHTDKRRARRLADELMDDYLAAAREGGEVPAAGFGQSLETSSMFPDLSLLDAD